MVSRETIATGVAFRTAVFIWATVLCGAGAIDAHAQNTRSWQRAPAEDRANINRIQSKVRSDLSRENRLKRKRGVNESCPDKIVGRVGDGPRGVRRPSLRNNVIEGPIVQDCR